MKTIKKMSKQILTLLLAQVLCFSAFAQELAIRHLGDGSALIQVNTQKKYLVLPVEEAMQDVRMSMIVGTQEVKSFTVRLAVNKVDYYVPIDISAYSGKKIGFKFAMTHQGFRNANVELLNTQAIRQLSLADNFDSSNKEKFRPVYHFTPAYGWMNDPNGLVYKDGEYHLFYQYNPYGSRWGNMTWGHAVSTDLTHWNHLSPAIEADALGSVFSGSAVVDVNNTAGFGAGAIVAIYTSASDSQMQSLAYSTDNGRTFHKYEGNPVLTANVKDFRDPKVFWHQDTKRWIMALAVGQEIRFYSSPNLKDWAHESSFGQDQGAHGGVWECPDLFEIPIEGTKESRWVLLVNINPGGPFGGSATQYFVGSFDGHRFVNENPEATKWMDYGKDHYATVTWSNVPRNRRLALAWMSNWQYANEVPTMQYRSANSVPRELTLYRIGKKNKEAFLKSAPVKELLALRGKGSKPTSLKVKGEKIINPLLTQNNGTYEMELTIKQAKEGSFTLRLQNQQGEEVALSLDMGKHTFTMDRSKSGMTDFSKDFAVPTVVNTEGGDLTLRLFVDKSSIEVFGNDGRFVMTNLVFPTTPYNQVTMEAQNSSVQVKDFSVYQINY